MLALGFLLVDRELGIYFLVNRLVLAAQLVTQHGIAEVSLTPLSRLATDPARLRNAAVRLLELGLLASCAGLGLLAVAGPALLPMVFGAAWTDAGLPLRLLAALSTAGAVTAFCGVVLVARGHAGPFARLTAAAALLQLACAFIGAHWGLVATVLAIGAAQVATAVPALRLLSRHCGVPARLAWTIVLRVVALMLAAIGVALWVEGAGGIQRQVGAAGTFIAIMLVGSALLLRGEITQRLARLRQAAPRRNA